MLIELTAAWLDPWFKHQVQVSHLGAAKLAANLYLTLVLLYSPPPPLCARLPSVSHVRSYDTMSVSMIPCQFL